MGNIPSMNNELGTRYKGDEPERERKAAEDMVKKFTLSLASNLEVAIWFPFENERHNIVGLLDERKRDIRKTIKAFRASMNFLNHPPSFLPKSLRRRNRTTLFFFPLGKSRGAMEQRKKIINIPKDS